MFVYNNTTVLRPGRAWTDINGVQHPGNWNIWDAATKAANNVVEVAIAAKPDERFYWVTGPDLTGAYTSVERALEDVNEVDENGDPLLDADGVQIVTKGLKSQWIARTKETQGSLLAQTDWAYTRKQDTGADVPSSIQTYRNAVRTSAAAIEAEIAACADMDAFKKLFEVPVDANNDPTGGNAPIHNWPDPI